ncbi:MAG: hypothetical protein Q4G33_13965 [bacterium]|nr:hypothetical protein [bacterium]
MNYYFLLEDSESFIKVLPYWLKHMGFNCTRVMNIAEIKQNNYVLQSGHGVTQLITRALFDTIDTIINYPNTIDYLIIILDTENLEPCVRKAQVMHKIKEKYSTKEFDFKIEILVCNHCFETWLLGAKDIYPHESVNPDSFFYPYYKHYNVSVQDPENMLVPNNINETIAKYHFHYLHELFRYKRIQYRKNKPNYVQTKEYFDLIVERVHNTMQIESFQIFFDFFKRQTMQIDSM